MKAINCGNLKFYAITSFFWDGDTSLWIGDESNKVQIILLQTYWILNDNKNIKKYKDNVKKKEKMV